MKANKKLILSSVLDAFANEVANMGYVEVETLRKNLEAAENLTDATEIIWDAGNYRGSWFEFQASTFETDYAAEISDRYDPDEVAYRLGVEYDEEELYNVIDEYHWEIVELCELNGWYDLDQALSDTFTARELLEMEKEEALEVIMDQAAEALNNLREMLESWYATVDACKELLDERWN